VLAMALLMSGLNQGFTAEIDRTVSGVGAQSWVLSANAHGSIAGAQVFPQSDAAAIARSPGVKQASPLAIVLQQALRTGGETTDVEVIGVQPGGLGDPAVTAGRTLSGPGQLVADASAGVSPGTRVTVGAMTLSVVGQVTHRTMLGGTPVVYMALPDVQRLAFAGSPLITAVVTRGTPATVPAGLAVNSNSEIEQTELSNLAGAISTLKNAKWIMWLIAAIIVGALLYVSSLQRVRDFAVIKALGSSSAALFGSLALQSVVVTLLAAAFAMVICNFMTGLFKQPVVIPGSAFATLPLIAALVGLIASLVGLRRATGADPAAAFNG
jgi:putative ABC transport system permease protein